ncbi:universal stress protein [Nonomuraea sp. NPDC049655]|uniref:universal stress protein n=1 Tax=Nonomuraea sp. NPDC049655 TaxID=3364355 RepID=UPI0037B2E900
MSIRLIVAGTDGTEDCAAALLWAADEAARRGARLVVVHAWEPSIEHRAPYAPCPPRPAGFEEARASAVLDQAVALVVDRFPGVAVEARLVRGRPETALADQARGAGLLVLGSAARPAGDGRLGAVLLSCLRLPPCPVVVVQAAATDGGTPPRPPAFAGRHRGRPFGPGPADLRLCEGRREAGSHGR